MPEALMETGRTHTTKGDEAELLEQAMKEADTKMKELQPEIAAVEKREGADGKKVGKAERQKQGQPKRQRDDEDGNLAVAAKAKHHKVQQIKRQRGDTRLDDEGGAKRRHVRTIGTKRERANGTGAGEDTLTQKKA